MNLVLDDAEEVYIEKSGKETKPSQDLGTCFLFSTTIRGTGCRFQGTLRCCG